MSLAGVLPAAASAGRRPRRPALEPWLYLSPALLLIATMLLVPVAFGLAYSLRRFGAFRSEYVGLDQYRAMLADSDLGWALLHTLWWTAGSLVLQFLLGLGLALALNRDFAGRRLVQALVFLPWAVPSFLSGLTWAWLFNPVIGPLPHWLAALGILPQPTNILADPATAMWGPIIANVWFGVPFFAITLLAALKAIPPELHEAAAIDGAGILSRFRHITWPLVTPTTFMLVILNSLGATIGSFDLVRVLTDGGPLGATTTLVYLLYQRGFVDLNMGSAAALGYLLFIGVLLATIAQFRFQRLWVHY